MSLSLTDHNYAALLAFESSLERHAQRCLTKSRACKKRAFRRGTPRNAKQSRQWKHHYAATCKWLLKFHNTMGCLHIPTSDSYL